MTNGKMSSIAALIAAAAVASALSAPCTALGQSATTSDPTDAGKAVFKRANCFGCHKWHGNGGGVNAPPMTFAVDGKQYIAILVGLGGAWDKWFIDATPELKRIQPGSMLYVFAL